MEQKIARIEEQVEHYWECVAYYNGLGEKHISQEILWIISGLNRALYIIQFDELYLDDEVIEHKASANS